MAAQGGRVQALDAQIKIADERWSTVYREDQVEQVGNAGRITA
jgi:hypothetical protein